MRSLISVLLLLVIASPIRADVTQTAQAFTDVVNPDNNLLQTNWNTATSTIPGLATPTISQFGGDPSSLAGINVTLDYTLKSNYALQAVTPSTVTASVTPSIGPTENWPLSSFVPVLKPTDFIQSVVANAPGSFSPPSSLATQSFTTTIAPDSPDFAKFLGSGQIAFPLSADATGRITSSSANGGGSIETLGGANLSVTYSTLNAVIPEPSSIVLLAVGSVIALFYRARHAIR